MSDKSINENFNELSDAAKRYLQAKVELYKIQFIERMAKVGTYFFTVNILIMSISLILMFLTFAFSFWYGKEYGTIIQGFLISAAFYFLLSIIVLIFRKSIFVNQIVKRISAIIFKNDE